MVSPSPWEGPRGKEEEDVDVVAVDVVDAATMALRVDVERVFLFLESSPSGDADRRALTTCLRLAWITRARESRCRRLPLVTSSIGFDGEEERDGVNEEKNAASRTPRLQAAIFPLRESV